MVLPLHGSIGNSSTRRTRIAEASIPLRMHSLARCQTVFLFLIEGNRVSLFGFSLLLCPFFGSEAFQPSLRFRVHVSLL
jgi:hypothetical protein